MTQIEARDITIVGTGLLGGSLGLALRAAGFTGRLVGVGRRETTLNLAVERGCIDRGTTDLSEAVSGAQLIVLATPISATVQTLRELGQLAQDIAPDAVITDLGSTKQAVVAAAQQHLPAPLARQFVGGHPMAGRETSGPEAAIPDLFRGKPVVLTPTAETSLDAVAMVEHLWRVLGMRIVKMTAAQHDRTVARISHLPHAAAVLLVEIAGARGGLEIASTGFADSTRVASGDPSLWADIFLSNREAVAESIEQFTGELHRLRRVLLEGDRQKLTELLSTVKLLRDAWAGERNAAVERLE